MQRTTYKFSIAERVRLWLSYQRYSFLLGAAAVAVAWLSAAYLPWYLWLVTGGIAAWMGGFAVYVFRRFPRKLRATALASRRIESGRFSPRSLQSYCGDPCYRVVAREILTRAGYGRVEKSEWIARLSFAERDSFRLSVVVDHENGRQVRLGGDFSSGHLLPQIERN